MAAFLSSLPIAIDDETAERAFPAIIGLAPGHGLTSYDAAYLDLAVRRGLPLASLDRDLRKAAQAVGVVLYTAHSGTTGP